MSQDKRKLFGSRISSIFSSSDSHHHIKVTEKNLSHNATSTKGRNADSEPLKSKATSQLQPSKNLDYKSPRAQNSSMSSVDSNYINQESKNSDLHVKLSQPTQSLKPQFSEIPHEKQVQGYLSKEPHASPRANLTRKPPPESFISSETKSKSSHNLSDVIGSLEREIDNMRVESENYRTAFTESRPIISHLNSSEGTFPLNIIRTSEEKNKKDASIVSGQQNLVSMPIESKQRLHAPKDFGDSPKSPSDFLSHSIYEQRLFISDGEDMTQALKETKDIYNGKGGELQYESAVSHKEFSSENSSFERSLSSPEYNTESGSVRRSFISTDHKGPSNHLREPSDVPQCTTFRGTDFGNAESQTSMREQTPSGSNDSFQRSDIAYSQNTSAENSNQESESYLNSTTGTNSSFLVNWDEINDSVSESTPGELNEINRSYKFISPGFASSTEVVPDGMQSLSAHLNHPSTHTRMSSMSSVYSAGSTRHVSLAALKMAFNLRPGEGEKSNYVDALRKGAGTSFNEAGPGKWKLPTGIMPVEKRDLMMQSTKKFTRGVSSTGYRTKKSSGVELKHGHLQPRLLAAEVDEGESTNKFGALGRSSTLQNKTITPVTSKSSTPSAGLRGLSRTNSLERVNTLASISTAGDLQSSLSKVSNSRQGSTVSSTGSVGSISNDRNVDIYYQHQGFKFDNGDNSSVDFYNRDRENSSQESDNEESEDEQSRLFLANPDSDSE